PRSGGSSRRAASGEHAGYPGDESPGGRSGEEHAELEPDDRRRLTGVDRERDPPEGPAPDQGDASLGAECDGSFGRVQEFDVVRRASEDEPWRQVRGEVEPGGGRHPHPDADPDGYPHRRMYGLEPVEPPRRATDGDRDGGAEGDRRAPDPDASQVECQPRTVVDRTRAAVDGRTGGDSALQRDRAGGVQVDPGPDLAAFVDEFCECFDRVLATALCAPDADLGES